MDKRVAARGQLMNFKQTIRQNAGKIAQLHTKMHELFKHRNHDLEQKQAWQNACAQFHANYSHLAFIGGVETARDRLRAGETEAIEYALDFLEVRPYFFRSGYMYKDFMRVLRNSPLSPAQRLRYNQVHERYLAYRFQRQKREN